MSSVRRKSLSQSFWGRRNVWEENLDSGNGQHRHLRRLIDSVDFWVMITYRNAGHVRLCSAERCHVAFKSLPLSGSPANRVGAKDFCPSTLQTSCVHHFIPRYITQSLWTVQFPHRLHGRAVTSGHSIISSLPTKCSPKRIVKMLDLEGKTLNVHLKWSL